MRKISGILLTMAFAMSGCTSSVVKYDSANTGKTSIKVALGSKENVHVKDKIFLLERKCVKSPKVPICGFDPIGTLTVKEVKEDFSIVEPDQDLIFREGSYFKFAMHCEDDSEKCRSDILDKAHFDGNKTAPSKEKILPGR